MERIALLQAEIQPYRAELVQHPVYAAVQNIDDLRVFMEHHVFAVWDFMSLLKSLQQDLTCISIPWRPIGDPSARYLVNEIVLNEESDIHPDGGFISHFELYLEAMDEIGASSKPLHNLIEGITMVDFATALKRCKLVGNTRQFLVNTFSVAESYKPWIKAAVFTFGREEVIPQMFLSFIDSLNKNDGVTADKIKYYLQRHIDVDGDKHSHMAMEMTLLLCGDDPIKWKEATQAVIASLESRKLLWDGILAAIQRRRLYA
jgi:hypothetical protein